MPEEQKFKRNIAYKFRIGDILIGNPVLENERFSFLESEDKKVIRVNVIGNVTEKYESEGEKKYIFITIDDGSGQIKIKAFSEDAEKLKGVYQGQTILCIGVLKFFNNELYIFPEIVKEYDSKYLIVRKLEIEKEKTKKNPMLSRKDIIAVKDNILEIVRNSEAEGGIDVDKLIMNPMLLGISPDSINQELKKLLEEGIIFEPRPGKVRWLG